MCTRFYPQIAYIVSREIAYSSCQCGQFVRYDGKMMSVEEFCNEIKKETPQYF